MHDLDELGRGLTGQVRPPSLEAIVETARRRRRRALTGATAVLAAGALLIGGGVVLTAAEDRAVPPADEPPSGPLTPEGIVTGEDSRLVAATTSYDDPDVRLALWEADCPGCRGGPDGPGSTKSALAVTTDAFDRTTYLAAPALGVQAYPVGGEPHGPRIESPAADLFLVVDTVRPGEWLVGTDGTVRPVERVRTPIAPAEPRSWFRCHPAETPSAWEGYSQMNPEHLYPWCALDADSATAYEWPARWNGSQELPVSGQEPWGIDDLAQPTFAWWEVDGQRHRRFLTGHPGEARGPVYGAPADGPMFFTRFQLESGLDLLEPRDGPGLRTTTLDAPDLPFGTQLDLVTRTPGGALLAVSTYPETLIWRTEDLAGGGFELVHAQASTSDPDPTRNGWVHEPVTVGDRIQVMTPRGVVLSDDDGGSWTEITTWR